MRDVCVPDVVKVVLLDCAAVGAEFLGAEAGVDLVTPSLIVFDVKRLVQVTNEVQEEPGLLAVSGDNMRVLISS